MVFRHDDRPALDDFCCLPYRHSREVHGRVQQDSDAGGETTDKDKGHGGEKPVIQSMEEYFGSNGIIAISTNQSSAHDDIHSLPRPTSDGSDGNERSDGKHVHHIEEELCMVACKRARHEVCCNESHSNDLCPLESEMNIPSAAVHGESGGNVDALGEGKPCSMPVEVVGAGNRNLETEEVDNSENQTKNSCNSCDSEDEAALSELPRQAPRSQFFGRSHPSHDEAFSEDSPLSFCDRFPRKHVALGPDHQAYITSWGSWNATDSDKENSKRLMGTPVLTMPDSSSNKAIAEIVGVGGNANYCGCIDKGSISCTRRHVAEARERTRHKLGLQKFVELGFHDMGEDVALGWSEEEELLFEKIVFSYPASMGMNFWNVLPRFFPSRSTKDLVSYYFNVFILRKRAAQNRFHPWNVDSDDDEWQESDSEFTTEDSGHGVYYQPPVDQEEVIYVEEEEDEDEEEEEEEEVEEEEDDFQEVDEEGFEEPDVSDETTAHGQPDFSLKPRSAFADRLQKRSQESVEEHDAQDESCTSYEGQHGGVDSAAYPFAAMASPSIVTNAPHKNIHEECRSNSSSTCMPGSCDHKEWDVGYFTSGKVDFLPTCRVIEEVFGKDSRDDESMGCEWRKSS